MILFFKIENIFYKCYNIFMSEIDLHIHTKYSDGELNEKEIIEKIKENNIKEFAICDHDTIVGSKKVYKKLKKEKINLIFHTGIEFSCRIFDILNGINIHLLVRDFEYNNKKLLILIKKMSKFRKIKLDRMIDYIYKIYNIKINKKLVIKKFKDTKSIGKPHLYEILKLYKNVDREEYYNYMDKLYTEDLKLDVKDIFKALKNKKGNTTLAHPIEIMEEYNLDYSNIEKIVEYLKNLGLYGLEVYHSNQTIENQKEFLKIAKKYNLFKSYGSDFHGENIKPDVKLGKCYL